MANQFHPIKVDILVCTYKRPVFLANTLEGIEKIRDGGMTVRVIVVDNDSNESARKLVEKHASNSKFCYVYLIQPVQNISLTRNCAIGASNSDYVALIDDDEVPEAGWIESLVKTAEDYQVPIVFGPVLSKYEKNVPGWIMDGRFFEYRARYLTGSKIPLLEMRTGNVLISCKLLSDSKVKFDPKLGLSGGEDYQFFSRLVDSGAIGIWCDVASVHEYVPESRTNVKWLVKRSFRIGSVDGFSRRRSQRPLEIFTIITKGILLSIIGIVIAVFWCFLYKHRCVNALRKFALGLGMLYGVFYGPYSEYKKS